MHQSVEELVAVLGPDLNKALARQQHHVCHLVVRVASAYFLHDLVLFIEQLKAPYQILVVNLYLSDLSPVYFVLGIPTLFPVMSAY